MRRVLFSSAIIGTAAFFGGKYLKEEQTRLALQASELQKTNRNHFHQGTITPPFRLLEYPHYYIHYSTYHKSPIAVHEHLLKDTLEGDAPRSKFFFPDQQIKEKHFQVDQSYFWQTEAFKRFNINRGHMAAAGNYSNSQSQKFHTFAFSNIIPQNGYNNGGIWAAFERYARKLALGPKCESVEVISGPIYLKGSTEPIDITKARTQKLIVLKENGIPIPQKLYKIIKCNTNEKAYYSAFEFTNSETYDNENTLEHYKVPLAKVEKQTGLTFNISGGELSEIDESVLKTTKKEIDYEFYFKLISGSTSIRDMSEAFRRAKEQRIQVPFDLFTEKIRELTKADMNLIASQKILQCERLRKLLRLNKKIFFLYHLDKTKDLREERMEESYNQCLLKKGTEQEEQKVYKQLTEQLGEDLLKYIKK